MRLKLFIAILFICPTIKAQQQKPVDFSAIDHWTSQRRYAGDVAISPDGKYFTWVIGNQPYKNMTLVVQSTENSWKKEYIGAKPGFFSADSKYYIFMQKDSLCFLPTGGEKMRIETGITQLKKSADNTWICWQKKDKKGALFVEDIEENISKQFTEVSNYAFDNSGKWLTISKSNNELTLYSLSDEVEKSYDDILGFTIDKSGKNLIVKYKKGLKWIDIGTGKELSICSIRNDTTQITGVAFDDTGSQMTFSTENDGSHSIWYYKKGMPSAIKKVEDGTGGIDKNCFISGPPSFTKNGNFIEFSLEEKSDNRKVNQEAISLDVWSHTDTIFYSAQSKNSEPKKYHGTIGTSSASKVVQLEHELEEFVFTVAEEALVIKKGSLGDRFWEKKQTDSCWLVSLKDGRRRLVKVFPTGTQVDFSYSAGERYLLWFDPLQGCHYFSYDLRTETVVDISEGIPDGLLGYNDQHLVDISPSYSAGNGIARKLINEEGILVYDNYDVWLLDYRGKMQPANITAGYGRRHGIVLRLTADNNSHRLVSSSNLLLTAFNERTMENGFYRKSGLLADDPELLYMGSYFFCQEGGMPSGGAGLNGGITPLKAEKASIWVVLRQCAKEAPNYFLTRDFKSWKQITDLQPQRGFSWLTAELINFEQLDGIKSKGVLYKPADFDPTKKYPLLINYYDYKAWTLNQFPDLNYTGGGHLNIPWFVSHGYLVFCPDIYFSENKTGLSTLNAVEGAAISLSDLPCIDSTRIGISGHSFAGGTTNYIITHSKRYAAVLEGAGISDRISSILQLSGIEGQQRFSRLGGAEYGIKSNMWEDPTFWLSESPIMSADKVKSPLLIFHCKNDSAVPWPQAVEMFTALRRLDKKVWMLQYDGEKHNLNIKKNYQDFTIRITQYFDHYLKGEPPPRWMTQGIPLRLKQIEDGLALDPDGKCGKDCPVCNKKTKNP